MPRLADAVQRPPDVAVVSITDQGQKEENSESNKNNANNFPDSIDGEFW